MNLGASCPTGSRVVPAGFSNDARTPNKFYQLVDTKMTFAAAKKHCQSLGADLPNLDSEEEFNIIEEFESKHYHIMHY